MSLRKGNIPDFLAEESRTALRAKSGESARDILAKARHAAYANRADSYVDAAIAYLATPDAETLPSGLRIAVAEMAADGDSASLAKLWPSVIRRDEKAIDATLRDPQFKQEREDARNTAVTVASVERALQAASVPDSPGVIRDDLFGTMMSMVPDGQVVRAAEVMGKPPEWVQAKQALLSYSIDSLSTFMLSKSGKVMNQAEQERLRTAWINGNESSANAFVSKANAILRAQQQMAEASERRARAIVDARGMPSRLIDSAFESDSRRIALSLLGELESAATQDAENFPDVPLTPEQEAILQQNGGGR